MIFNPKVSIVVPVYNGSNYLRRAIDSALAQTYENFEVLVVNDGSRDEGATTEIALSYGDKIRYFEKENGGAATALNMGIEKMRGEYFSWLSHDDEYYPEKIAEQVAFLSKHRLVDTVVFTDYAVIDEQSQVLDIIKCYDQKISEIEAIAFGLLNGCSMLIPKTCFDTVGGFRSDLPTTQDYDMWTRIASKFPIRHLSQVLIKSRHHSQQQSRLDITHQDESNDFYIRFLEGLQSDIRRVDIVSEDFYIKQAAFLKKMRYKKAFDWVSDRCLSKSWLTRIKVLYYCYINTCWGNRAGLCTIIRDPRRIVYKIKRNIF